MENLGYKEGSAKPKSSSITPPIVTTTAAAAAVTNNVITKRRMSRARPSIVEAEALPLSISPRYNTNSYQFLSHCTFHILHVIFNLLSFNVKFFVVTVD
jgi:hypothetical protein